MISKILSGKKIIGEKMAILTHYTVMYFMTKISMPKLFDYLKSIFLYNNHLTFCGTLYLHDKLT
jgi:hypothetical protein